MNMGRNTPSGQMLQAYVERIETCRAEKKAIGEHEAAILAEAKAQGFVPAAIRAAVRIRAMPPDRRQEAEALLDTYLHALGMAAESPIMRHVSLMSVDRASREEVIEALKKFVPDKGSITVEAGGRPVRLERDRKGEVFATEVVDMPTAAPPQAAPRSLRRDPPPDVDDAGAATLGAEAFRENKPIIANPFPFGDARRPLWDAAWRKAAGNDGMDGED